MYGERACVLARACPHLRYRCGCTLRMYGERVCVLAAHVCGTSAVALRAPRVSPAPLQTYSVDVQSTTYSMRVRKNERTSTRALPKIAGRPSYMRGTRALPHHGWRNARTARAREASDGWARRLLCELTAHLARHVSVRLRLVLSRLRYVWWERSMFWSSILLTYPLPFYL